MKRLAFTLVELLAVISIVGLLIAITLPAVQMVREAARKTACGNNVRQLSLGLMNFESSQGQLPMGLRSLEPIGRTNSSAHDFYGMSWITRILPHLEQNALWRRAKSDYELVPVPFGIHLGMQSLLPVVGCPSDPMSGKVQSTHQGYRVTCTNYLGVNGTNFQKRDGVFTYDMPIRFSMISDGLSNTLMIGERPPSKDFWYGWWYATGSGSESTGDVTLGVAELNPTQASGISSYLDDCPPGPYRYVAGRNEQCDTLHFWSHHPSGSNFALADGSVHFISYTTDSSVIEALASRAGQEVVGEY